jgi:hypothetical protein
MDKEQENEIKPKDGRSISSKLNMAKICQAKLELAKQNKRK